MAVILSPETADAIERVPQPLVAVGARLRVLVALG
jgi:hypothetical protein